MPERLIDTLRRATGRGSRTPHRTSDALSVAVRALARSREVVFPFDPAAPATRLGNLLRARHRRGPDPADPDTA
ncbi:MAG: hypothetical protein GXY15_09725 [Candidatus Hydrogenedentes bacterium]|nr:hypothetical protein [Candidatus Hydrogenedentota bacterium]